MLVLSRKTNESIIIDGDIEVIVLGVEGDNVKLGIRAPKSKEIYRKELYDTIIASNSEAAQTSTVPIDQLAQLMRGDRTNITDSKKS